MFININLKKANNIKFIINNKSTLFKISKLNLYIYYLLNIYKNLKLY